jgi:hypothetical protein
MIKHPAEVVKLVGCNSGELFAPAVSGVVTPAPTAALGRYFPRLTLVARAAMDSEGLMRVRS